MSAFINDKITRLPDHVKENAMQSLNDLLESKGAAPIKFAASAPTNEPLNATIEIPFNKGGILGGGVIA